MRPPQADPKAILQRERRLAQARLLAAADHVAGAGAEAFDGLGELGACRTFLQAVSRSLRLPLLFRGNR